VTENPLDHHVGHTQTVQIASESTPCGVPAVPFRNTAVPFELVVRLAVIGIALLARLAAVQRGQD